MNHIVSKYLEYPEIFSQFAKDWDILNYKKYDISRNDLAKFSNGIDWARISKQPNISIEFATKFKHKLNWTHISMFNKCSPEFIEQFKDELIMYYVNRSK